MDLTSPKIIKEIFAKYNAKPSKRLGQNFLIDKNILEKIILSSQIKPDDIIIEVGPGIGVLTQELAKKAGKIIAIEKDKKMIEILAETLKNFQNIEIINADILKIKNLKIKNYKIIANIPYYLTSPLIRNFLESENQPAEMILMLQKEVAQRICEKPPKMSLLSVSVQFYAEAKILFYVSKNSFWPAPKVDSAVIRITPQKLLTFNFQPSTFFRVAKAGFSQPRKQLLNNLIKNLDLEKEAAEAWLKKNNINPKQRAETLSVQDWKNLTSTLPKV